METPFSFGKIATKTGFTNREVERERLESNFRSSLNTTLISPRRWGKSSLVQETARTLKGDTSIRFCFIDLFKVQSEEAFFQLYLKALIRATSSKPEEILKNIKTFFSQFLPKISIGFNNDAQVDIKFTREDINLDWEDVLNMAETLAIKKKIRLVVCIDEFQNIGKFGNSKAFQKKLRSVWQHHQKTAYCLYGSKRHMLQDMFQKQSMPFYKFGDVIYLKKISSESFVPFIKKAFSSTKKNIDTEAAQLIVDTVENHPYHTQELAHFTWSITDKTATVQTVQKALENLYTDNKILYYNTVENLSAAQINLLKAIIDGNKVLTGNKVVNKYKLGSSSNVIRAKKALVQKEVIDTLESHIEFINPTFKLWFRDKYMID